MPSRIFRLDLDRVHFGAGGLDRSGISLTADTLFSALCIEAFKADGGPGLDDLVKAVKVGSLRFTDGLPYVGAGHGTRYLVPKPLVHARPSQDSTVIDEPPDSAQKKLAKRIEFLPIDLVDAFVVGQVKLTEMAAVQSEIGVAGVADRAAIRNGKDDAEPYRVGFFTFKSDAGLWLLAAGSEGELDLLTMLLEQLAHVGVGGERSSGYGQFTLVVDQVSDAMSSRVEGHQGCRRLMLLATSLPADAELDSVMEGATYRLIKRSGFVASHTYAGTQRRKQDIYKFAAGSVFRRSFFGVVADVGRGGSHPVFSYAKPIFLALPEAAP